jgi:hypothetical protein
LPLSKSDFTTDKQSQFSKSIATAVGAKSTDVTLDQIESINRRGNVVRRLAESVLVYTSVKAANAKEADAMAKSITIDKINAALEKAGLPKATMTQAPTVSSASTSEVASKDEGKTSSTTPSPTVGGGGHSAGNTSKQSTTDIPIVIGAVVGGSALILCILSACYYFRRRQSKQEVQSWDGEAKQEEPLPVHTYVVV